MPNTIIGKKVILFGFEPQDLEHFIKLHREDRHGYLQKYCLKEMSEEEAKKYFTALLVTGQLLIFTVMTKEGKASRRGGYIYLSDISTFACSLTGIMDKEFIKGLTRQLRRDKYTYSQDTINTLVDWCFGNFPTMERIETSIVTENKPALALVQKCGFIKEGILRHYLKVDGQYKNVQIFSILRGDKNVK
jgi:hypothetical protein